MLCYIFFSDYSCETVLSNGTQQLPSYLSYLSNRVANMMQRSWDTHRRWKKALLRLSCSFDESMQWKLLQGFVVESSKLFKDATPTLFSNK
ncbi:Uncharacterized protein OBRU01_20781 [Operophtera brumata]|uniref:Uncharacterized protein n=1 Tax=Operophtera brumata TaxID=104452 RepID=A0A0L7KSL5_OPEBR|nr:Uncharacterized protein OBRU01_20781 [Operophtera brumata]